MSKTIFRVVAWVSAALLAAAGVALWWFGQVPEASYALIVLAAATSVVQLFLQLADSAEQREGLAQQARDIKRLASIAEQGEQRQLASQPQATVGLLNPSTGTVGDHLIIKRIQPPAINAAAIADREVRALSPPPDPASPDPLMAAHLAANRLAAQLMAAAGGEDDDAYRERVQQYGERLKAWLEGVRRFAHRRATQVYVPLRFGNNGGAPLRNAKVVFTMPDGVGSPDELDVPKRPPERPQRLTGQGGLSTRIADLYDTASLRGIIDFPPAMAVGSRGLEGPHWAPDGKDVQYTFDELLHRLHYDAVEDDGLVLTIERDGDYDLAWKLFAANQTDARSGVLHITVRTEATNATAYTDLDSVKAAYLPDATGAAP